MLIIAAILSACHGNEKAYDLKIHKIMFSSDEKGEKVAVLDLTIYDPDNLVIPDYGGAIVGMGTGFYNLKDGKWNVIEDNWFPSHSNIVDIRSRERQRLEIDLEPLTDYIPGVFRIAIGPFNSDTFRIDFPSQERQSHD